MKMSTILVLSTSLVAATPRPALAGEVIFEETWDEENDGVGVYGYDSFMNWIVTAGDVDLVGNGFDDFYPGRGLYLDLDGFAGIPGGRMETKENLLLEPGTYTLEVDLGGGVRSDENNSVLVSLGTVYSEAFGPFPSVFDVPSDMTTFIRFIQVEEQEVAKLVIDHSIFSPEGDDDGPYIDVIRLSRVQDSDADGVPDGDDLCEDSDLDDTVVIDGCDSGAPNPVDPSGCTIIDYIDACAADAVNHGGFISCVAQLINHVAKEGIVSGKQMGAIKACASKAKQP